MAGFTPLRGALSFGGNMNMADIQEIVDKLNALEECCVHKRNLYCGFHCNFFCQFDVSG